MLTPRVIAGVPSQPLSHLSLLVHGDAAIQRLTPRVQIGPAPARRALPGLAEVSCIPLAVAHVPGPWSLEPPGLASIARSPTIPHIAPLHPLAFVPPVMSAPRRGHPSRAPHACLAAYVVPEGRSNILVNDVTNPPGCLRLLPKTFNHHSGPFYGIEIQRPEFYLQHLLQKGTLIYYSFTLCA